MFNWKKNDLKKEIRDKDDNEVPIRIQFIQTVKELLQSTYYGTLSTKHWGG